MSVLAHTAPDRRLDDMVADPIWVPMGCAIGGDRGQMWRGVDHPRAHRGV